MTYELTQLRSALKSAEEGVRLIIGVRARDILAAIKGRNLDALGEYAHPLKGVRFSPYAYIDVKDDIVLMPEDIKRLPADRTVRTWGAYDGSGEPIRLTGMDYIKKFVYPEDFMAAPVVGYNRAVQTGNTVNNIPEAYPNTLMVEYHFPGTEKYAGMDWDSLRLVFEQKGKEWYVVGIVKDQWTI